MTQQQQKDIDWSQYSIDSQWRPQTTTNGGGGYYTVPSPSPPQPSQHYPANYYAGKTLPKSRHDNTNNNTQTPLKKPRYEQEIQFTPTDHVTFMQRSVLQQQTIIASQAQTISDYRVEMTALRQSHVIELKASHDNDIVHQVEFDKERESLQQELKLVRESLAKRDGEVVEWQHKQDGWDNIAATLKSQKEGDAVKWARERKRFQQEIARLKLRGSKKSSQKKKKKKKKKESSEEEEDYGWENTVDINDDNQCLALYGFTAQQLREIAALVDPLQEAAHKSGGRGRKAIPPDKHRLLLTILHYFVHYTTLRVLSERFGMSLTTVSVTVTRQLAIVLPSLFDLSLRPQCDTPYASYVTGSYFLTLSQPRDAIVAASLWNTEKLEYGHWIHCVHESGVGKVVSFRVTTADKPNPDDQWLQAFVPLLAEADGPSDTVTRATQITRDYEQRLRGKFAIAMGRYRGTAQESDVMVRILLALCNLDLGYGNAIVVDGISADIDSGDEEETEEFSQ